MKQFFAGLDLGQSADYTALAIAERVSTSERSEYWVRRLQRFPLNTSYPCIVEKVKAIVSAPALEDKTMLTLDGTGVGRAVFDVFRTAQMPCPLYGVSIHSGDMVVRDGFHYRVPKKDLVGGMQILLQSGRLKIAESLPEAKTLNQTTGHWDSMKLCEKTPAVRAARSRASGAVEEQARGGFGSLRPRCATLRPNGKGSTASEEVYESSVVRFSEGCSSSFGVSLS
jgi:hypothetical protein